MKKFSFLSFALVLVGLACCASCGYLISTAVVSFGITTTISFESQTVFGVCVFSGSETDANASVESWQSQGAAGYVLENDGTFCVIANIFENKSDAELVQNNLSASGVESQILSLSTAAKNVEGNFSSEEKNSLTLCLKEDFELFKSLSDIAVSLDTSVISTTTAKLQCNSLFSNHVSITANFNTLFSESFADVAENLSQTESLLSNLISENYSTAAQTFSSLIKQTCCMLILEN